MRTIKAMDCTVSNLGKEAEIFSLACEGFHETMGRYTGIGITMLHSGTVFSCPDESWIAPLTDPKADAFIERIKKLGQEPVNTVEKVTVPK